MKFTFMLLYLLFQFMVKIILKYFLVYLIGRSRALRAGLVKRGEEKKWHILP